jgi:RNA polymerase sigma factor (sigma-70 family)
VSLERLKEEQSEALRFIATQLHLFNQPEPLPQIHPTVKKEADALLHQLILRLSDAERRIIMLIYFEAIENATEVAKKLGMNKNTIRVYHKRARDKLRKSPELSGLFEN